MNSDLDILKDFRTIVQKELSGYSESSEVAKIDSTLYEQFRNVSIRDLILSPEFFNAKSWLYPAHLEDIELIFEMKDKYGVHTVIDIEGFGSGKSTKHALILAIQIFKLLIIENPQIHYGLAPGTGIAFIMMSRTERQARRVAFRKVLPIFNNRFFNTYFPPQVDFEKMTDSRKFPSQLEFHKNIVIFPGTGSAASALGYDIFGASIDEANYLEVTTESKKALGEGTYDAAEQMYHEIFGRMFSRFADSSQSMPGIVCMFSNPRYKSDFLDRWTRKASLERLDSERWIDKDAKLLVIKRPTWSAKRHKFSKDTFRFDFSNFRVVE